MSSLNKVILLGNLTRDPEYKELSNGTPVAETGMALNRKFKDASGQLQEEVSFVDVTFWGNQAKTLRDYCHKGKQLAIEGRLKQDTWQADNGEKRSKLRVVCENLYFTGSKGDDGNMPAHRPSYADTQDDMPGLEKGRYGATQGQDVPF